MWYKIKQGRHRAYPLSLGIHTGKTQERYEVIFDDSCRYTLEGTDKEDWNKLVGWSYGILPWRKNMFPTIGSRHIGETPIYERTPAHHNNSIRIGWRYNAKVDKIEVCIYIYDSGIRKETIAGTIELEKKYRFDLRLEDNKVKLRISDISFIYNVKYLAEINTSMIPKWGYNLGLYFGGNNVAPHDMKIWIKKLKKH